MTQTWSIGGRTYTHAQLMELRKQGLDPRKDEIVMASVTPRKEDPLAGDQDKNEVVKPEENLKKAVETEVVNKDEPAKEAEVKPEVPVEPVFEEPEDELPTNFMKLKKLAKEAGMEMTKETKKEEILAFLSK